ncbi:hypothetical protein DNTS_029928, partial [Danionella cerebrum]
ADELGLHCINCQGNTRGRHCESCKEGFYHQRAGEDCLPCNCNIAGSQGPACNHEGLCTCKYGINGDKCDRCHDGSPVTPSGCQSLRGSCRSRYNGHLTYNTEECLPCFCNGHSSVCTAATGYSVNNISSTFENDPEGWWVTTAQGGNPPQVLFRWSPTHKDLEVISKEVLPVYLSAPASFLGNQALSYGQTLSFSLRLVKGVRHPSVSDVILEGAGFKVSASLGDLRTVVPCGKKKTYTFRLDEQLSSKWKPQLSSTEFQTLLSNLTAVKIRDVAIWTTSPWCHPKWVLAPLHSGSKSAYVLLAMMGCFVNAVPTDTKDVFQTKASEAPVIRVDHVIQKQSCFSQKSEMKGSYYAYLTGGCYSADETQNLQMCPTGYYMNHQQSSFCQKCPCPEGEGCYVISGSGKVMCSRCPRGIIGENFKSVPGSSCESCAEGFYGDPVGVFGPPKQCQPCQCNGHTDQNAINICDRRTGECRKCPNHRTGSKCENCEDGYYHSNPTKPCQACKCDQQGSESNSCNDKGQCTCKDGYDGLMCEKSTCPSCFYPVKRKIEVYEEKLKEMEDLLKGFDEAPVSNTRMEEGIKAAEAMMQTMEIRAKDLTNTEKQLQDKLANISRSQLREEWNMEALLTAVEGIRKKDEKYRTEVSLIQKLISGIRLKLQEAKQDFQLIEIPSGDGWPDDGTFSDLLKKATDLAEQHQSEAAAIETIAASSLSDSKKAFDLLSGVINRENTVKGEIKNIKRKYEAEVNLAVELEKKASELTGGAAKEKKESERIFKQLSDLEKKLPQLLAVDITGVISMFDHLKGMVEDNLSDYQDFQQSMIEDKLLSRAIAAEAVKNRSLEIFAKNKQNLDKTLKTLKDFDGQIGVYKDSADAAIRKLSVINGTIQMAVADNNLTQEILDVVADLSGDTQQNIDNLTNTAPKLEYLTKSLPPSSEVLEAATKLQKDVDALTTEALDTRERLNDEKNRRTTQMNEVQNVVLESTGALEKAKSAREAVNDTLQAIADIMKSIGTPGRVESKRVSELQKAIAAGRSRVEQELKPKLRELEIKEAQQRRNIAGMIHDIDTILDDIANLEEIHKSIPDGCYNIPPIEMP